MKPSVCYVVLLVLLAGCANNGSSDYSLFYKMLRGSFTGRNERIKLADAAKIPHASIGIAVGTEAERLLVLATNNGGDQLWTSSEHIVVSTRDGRIMRTVGLGHDLAGMTAGSGAIPLIFSTAAHTVTDKRIMDLPDIGAYGTPVTCTARYVGTRTIKILGSAVNVFRVEEACAAPTLKWSFVNTYWLDMQNGRVWRSVQHVHPKLDAITTELLRPPE